MKKTISFLLVGMMMTSFLAGCSQTIPQTQGIKTVKIGVIAPLSGPAANYGEDAVNAYTYVVNKFNSENFGKINVQLIVEDGKCDSKTASSAAQKLISVDKTNIIVGGICSAETVPVGKIAQANGVVMLSPVSSAPDISDIGDFVFRYRNDANVTKKLSAYLNTSKINNLLILTENNDYGIGYAKGVKNDFKGHVEEERFQSDEKDFDMLAKKIMSNNNAEAILVITNSDANTINMYKAFEKQGIMKKFKGNIYGTELTVSDSVISKLGSLLDGIKVTNLISMEELGQRAQDFMKEYNKQNKALSAPLWIVLEAEAMKLAIDASVDVGNDGTSIKNYFADFNANNPRSGYFGNYYFTPERDAYGLKFLVYEIKDGKLVNGK